MAKICDNCGKRPLSGHLVSHSNVKSLRRFVPNVTKRKVFDVKLGTQVRRFMCTRCIRTAVKAPRAKAVHLRHPRMHTKQAAA